MNLEYIAKSGDVLNLVGNSYFTLTNFDAQTAANGNIATVVTANIDGDTVNNIQAQPRTIVMDLRINNNVNVEDAKRAILRVVKFKQSAKLIWTQNNKTVEIEGIVEAIEMPRWTEAVVMQVTLHCEQPFWEDINYVAQQINQDIPLHYFTNTPNDMLYFPEGGIAFGEVDVSQSRTFYNNGDVAVGMEIEISAFGDVTNPIIIDGNDNFFGIGYGTGGKKVVLHSGDLVRLSTVKGKKSITLNGVSIISRVKPRSTWLQLEAGKNVFTVASDDAESNMIFTISFKQRYV